MSIRSGETTVRITLWESFRAVFYTPFYASIALDNFRMRGIELDFDAVPVGVGVCDALRLGTANVAWGGPMRLMKDFDQRPADRPARDDVVGFCEVVARDPFFLVGRDERPFQLSDLLDLRLASVSEVPTPWLCLQHDLRCAGIDPERIDRVTDLTMQQSIEALADGRVDVIQIFQPAVEQLVASGNAFIWYAAADRGPTSYTTFFATRHWLKENQAAAHALVRGMQDGLDWIHGHEAKATAALVRSYFPDLDQHILSAAIDRYLRLKIWATTPIMDAGGFDRQADGLVSGGFIRTKPQMTDCIDVSIAQAALDESGASANG